MRPWYESRYGGLFRALVRVAARPHDPAVAIAAGEMPPWNPGDPEFGCSGAGWTEEHADLACVGEGIERLLARPLPRDESVLAAWNDWPRDEPACDPRRWVLFHDEQYRQAGFPFAPLARDTVCRWTCCRDAATGEPVWVPEELVYLTPRHGEQQRHTFGFSTGLTCGRASQGVLLRGVQEVIERDALVGAWWGAYPLEEWPLARVRPSLADEFWRRLERPNLRYRFYRVRSPLSRHVTLVSLAGEEEEGWVFSVGSACRESRAESWEKSLLEAVQGRHCVRRLLAQWQEEGRPELEVPKTFFEHALSYAVHPERLDGTVLHRAAEPTDMAEMAIEPLADLQTHLGPHRPVLFRNLTPPGLEGDGWVVLRVLIPGLQPLHGDHRLPFLGGPLWRSPTCSAWSQMPPHPFA